MYNLVYREEEREMISYFAYEDKDALRSTVDSSKPWSRPLNDADKEIMQRVQKIAEQRDILMAQVSIAWLLSKPTVISPIVGISKESHLKDAVAAASLKLTEEEKRLLEEPYVLNLRFAST
ncbi:hypothetical protein RMATCC62417_09979 [Rhizopus microsporus]|nr:hypothetical protein RMATCC62417_09979 [Rhizopus microsporus]